MATVTIVMTNTRNKFSAERRANVLATYAAMAVMGLSNYRGNVCHGQCHSATQTYMGLIQVRSHV